MLFNVSICSVFVVDEIHDGLFGGVVVPILYFVCQILGHKAWIQSSIHILLFVGVCVGVVRKHDEAKEVVLVKETRFEIGHRYYFFWSFVDHLRFVHPFWLCKGSQRCYVVADDRDLRVVAKIITIRIPAVIESLVLWSKLSHENLFFQLCLENWPVIHIGIVRSQEYGPREETQASE